MDESTENIIEDEINSLFNRISDKFNLNSGDITPNQHLKIDEFKTLLKQYIDQNKK